MWFNNVLVYRYETSEPIEFDTALADEQLKPCPPHARFIYGWLPIEHEDLVVETSGAALICLGKEERILPRAVINKFLTEKINHLEAEKGHKLKRADKAQIAEELEFELLPKSFCVQKRLLALFDTVSHAVYINSASTNQANQVLALLRKSLSGIQFEPFSINDNIALRFAEWINDPHTLDARFQLASDCVLFAPQDEKKRVNCKGYELPADEVLALLKQGLLVAELSLIWNERIQFTLTHDLTIKRLKCLDYLMDDFKAIEAHEDETSHMDARLALLTGELRELVEDIQGLFVHTDPLSQKETTVEEAVV